VQPSIQYPAPRTVEGLLNYVGPMSQRPRYYANDHSRDLLALEPRTVLIQDARDRHSRSGKNAGVAAPSLRHEGFELFEHRSRVENFRNSAEVSAVHLREIEHLLLRVSGADRVVVSGAGVLRFGESSQDAGKLNNSLPARFVHVDISDITATQFAARSEPKDLGGSMRRFAHYNVWRVLSPPPQDIPLAVCDARSLAPGDLVEADAVFDVAGVPEWSFEGWVIRYNPLHRWFYFSGMHRDEVLVFKTNDSDPGEPHCVPHSAFDDRSCPAGVPPRASIEMRGTAYWFE
jgi:hypothetical protein